MKPDATAKLLEYAIESLGSMNAVSRLTGIHESVLKRIKNGSTKRPHKSTVSKLLKAVGRHGS